MSNRAELVQIVDVVVAKFYDLEGNGAGGNLHVVLDDSNLEDDSIQWCIDNAIAHYPADVATVAVGRMLLALTIEERLAGSYVCPCCVDQLRAALLSPRNPA